MGILLFLTERRGPNVLVLITNCYRILTWRNTLTLSTLFNYQTNGNFGAAIIRPNTSPIFKSPSPKDRQDCGSRYLFNLSCTAMYYVMVHSMATTTAGTYNTYVLLNNYVVRTANLEMRYLESARMYTTASTKPKAKCATSAPLIFHRHKTTPQKSQHRQLADEKVF